MTRMTGPDCVVMCNLINTYIHTYRHTYIHTTVVTHICIYSSEPCTNIHVPKYKIYLVYKQMQTAVYTYI